MQKTYYINTPDPKKVICVRVYSDSEPELVSAELLVTADGRQFEPIRYTTQYIPTHGSFPLKSAEISNLVQYDKFLPDDEVNKIIDGSR